MIFTLLILAFNGIFEAILAVIFSIFPNPGYPSEINTALDFIIEGAYKMNFIIPVDTILTVIGLSFLIEIVVWLIRNFLVIFRIKQS